MTQKPKLDWREALALWKREYKTKAIKNFNAGLTSVSRRLQEMKDSVKITASDLDKLSDYMSLTTISYGPQKKTRRGSQLKQNRSQK